MSQLNELPDRSEGYRSVLLLAPLDTPAEDRACLDLLTRSAAAETNVLSVTFSATPLERVALWKRLVGEELPNRVAVIGTDRSETDGGVIDGGSTEQESEPQTDGRLVIDESLSDPVDPFELLLTIGRYLGEWAVTDERTLVCIRSVSALLDSMEVGQALHLIDVLNARFEQVGAVAHYHLDPDAHDQQEIANLRPLFDSVIEFDDELGWTISRGEDGRRQRRESASASERRRDSTGVGSARSEDPLVPRSFDTVVDVLSAPERRALLHYLAFECEGASTVTLDTLVEELRRLATGIGEDSWDTSERALRVSLLHVHLPRLDDAGIVEFDPESRTVQYRSNPALESVIEQIMQMEGLE